MTRAKRECECGASVAQPSSPMHRASGRHRAYAAAIGRNGSSPQPNVQVAVVEPSRFYCQHGAVEWEKVEAALEVLALSHGYRLSPVAVGTVAGDLEPGHAIAALVIAHGMVGVR